MFISWSRHLQMASMYLPLCLLAVSSPIAATPAAPSESQARVAEPNGVSALAGPHVPVAPPLDPQQAATHWRWVALKNDPNTPCPTLTTWPISGELFDLGSGSPIPPRLRRYCVYENTLGAGNPSEILARQEFRAAEPDAMAVVGMGTTLQTASWPVLRSRYLEQAGAVELPMPTTAPVPRLAVLDTAASNSEDPEWQPGNSPHGFGLVNLGRSLLCSKTFCVADVVTELSMPFLRFHRTRPPADYVDLTDGGLFGTISVLAHSIWAQTESHGASRPDSPLVLNLSLAWDGVFGGLESEIRHMPLEVRAVHDALSEAACRGALVLAATGNRGGGPGIGTGPRLPAAWERHPFPSFAECTARLGAPPDPKLYVGAGSYRPLLYAVGSVDVDGRTLATQQRDAEPRVVAYGDHAVATTPVTSSTSVMTGTSVSTLSVSAMASAVWAYRPTLGPARVMDLVWASGDDLGRQADVHLLGHGRPGVRRASLCRALRAACASGDCPAGMPAGCKAWPGTSNDLRNVDLEEFERTAPIVVDFAEIRQEYSSPDGACGDAPVFFIAGKAPEHPCPHLQFHDHFSLPSTAPQPEAHPCPSCWINGPLDQADEEDEEDTLVFVPGGGGSSDWPRAWSGIQKVSPEPGGKIYIEIDRRYVGQLTAAVLRIGDSIYHLGERLSAGSTLEIINLPPIPEGTEILLSFRLNRVRSVTSPILVGSAASAP